MWTWWSDDLDEKMVNVWKETNKEKIDNIPTHPQPCYIGDTQVHGLSLVTVKMCNNPKTAAACRNLLSFTRLKISWIAHAFEGGLGGFSQGWVWLGLLHWGRLCSTSSSRGQFTRAVMPFPAEGRGLGAQGTILDPLRMELRAGTLTQLSLYCTGPSKSYNPT